MLTLPLDPTDDLADPAFKDAASCTAWLKQLQLTNLQRAHSLLLSQLGEFNRYPMRGLERLNTLERLRETIHYVQSDYARKLVAKPLPLSASELQLFAAIVELWQTMVLCYRRCLQAHLAGDNQLAQYGALLCQRCLLYSGQAIFEHLRTGYEFDGQLWQQLHNLYAFSEQRGWHHQEIYGPPNDNQPRSITSDLAAVVMQPITSHLVAVLGQPSGMASSFISQMASSFTSSSISCHDIYVQTLLACYARPAELGRSQLQLLEHWLAQWSGTVSVERSYNISRGDAQPLALDLSSTHGLRPVSLVTHSETMRYLAMVPLSKLLRVKTIFLQQGKSPQQLDLGEHNRDDCIEFLIFLHQCWCENRNTRSDERSPVSKRVRLYYRPENIHARPSGNDLDAMGLQSETWLVQNESMQGARLICPDSPAGRLSHNQLVALRSDDAETFTLGATTWANVTRAGQLRIGVRYMPGTAFAIRLRVEDNAIPAFLLQAALNTPASLIVPRDCFKAGRAVTILHRNGETQNAKMGFSVERGSDYERVSFALV